MRAFDTPVSERTARFVDGVRGEDTMPETKR